MNVETGEVRAMKDLTPDDLSERSMTGGPLWVPLLKRHRSAPMEQRSQTERNRAKRDRKRAKRGA
jgi:hypothetical protein